MREQARFKDNANGTANPSLLSLKGILATSVEP